MRYYRVSFLVLGAILPCGSGLANIPLARQTKREPLSLPTLTDGGLPALSLEPMMGRYPPHRASPNTPTPKTTNLDSVLIDDNAQLRTPFDPDAQVHILRAAWSSHECEKAVDAARKYNQWSTGRHHLFPTTDIPAEDLPEGMGQVCLDLATEVILPHMAVAFDAPLSSLSFKDMFLAKYEPNGQPGLGKHTDGSALSFNMLLSDDFEGGGTWIEPVGLVQPRLGDVLMHRGDLLHEGCKVTKGSRFVLVGFVQQDDAYQEEDDNSGQSELLLKTIRTSSKTPLGMVLEVDEGDVVSSVMVMDIVENGAAAKAGVQKGDCLRGIYGNNDGFVPFDGQTFDQVMDVLAERKGLDPLLGVVVERWCG